MSKEIQMLRVANKNFFKNIFFKKKNTYLQIKLQTERII
jgi:hypothetical protein